MEKLDADNHSPENELALELLQKVEGRVEVSTVTLLEDVMERSTDQGLRDFAQLLLKRLDTIADSTVLRGETYDGGGLGQSSLDGDLEEVNPQVYLVEGGYEQVAGQFKLEFVKLEEDTNKFHNALCHELAHSFTAYIPASYRLGFQNELNEFEKSFFEKVSILFEKFLLEDKTRDKYLDNFNEFFVRAILSPDYMKGKYYQEVFDAFKNLYLNNQRKIVSLSKKVSRTE